MTEETPMTTTDATPVLRGTRRGRWLRGLLLTGAAAGLAVTGTLVAQAGQGPQRPTMPQSAQVEAASGVRFERVTLAADTGLIDVRYTVLDSTKARKWAADTSQPPVIKDNRNQRLFDRVAAMRDSHELRSGQTYYLIYLNSNGGVKRGDTIDLRIAGTTLTGITVE